jgi:hypothetical protein
MPENQSTDIERIMRTLKENIKVSSGKSYYLELSIGHSARYSEHRESTRSRGLQRT